MMFLLQIKFLFLPALLIEHFCNEKNKKSADVNGSGRLDSCSRLWHC